MDTDTKLRRSHIKLMRHPETCLYSGVILMGDTNIVDDFPTACTDGINTRYGRKFVDEINERQVAGLVLHENLHKALRHLMRYRKLMQEDAQTANAAMDYVVNDIIEQIKDRTLVQLPPGALIDVRFRNWSVLEVYDYLRSGNPPPQKQGSPQLGKGKPKRGKDSVQIGGDTFGLKGHDKHDDEGAGEITPEQMKKHEQRVNEAMQQGGMLAGRMGAKVPRAIKDALVDPIDWAAEMRDFVQCSTSGRTEYTYRRFNRRWIADDYYLPSTEDETVGEVLFAIDTSGSITGDILAAFAARVSEVCELLKPDKVRVLWWDTEVHGEQIFQGDYTSIRKLLKPQGGGGTHAGCVRDYVLSKRISADCLVVFTDGYTEQPVDWTGMQVPTLWLVTQNESFQVPPGNRKVKVERSI